MDFDRGGQISSSPAQPCVWIEARPTDVAYKRLQDFALLKPIAASMCYPLREDKHHHCFT